jgi:hypothetical protein
MSTVVSVKADHWTVLAVVGWPLTMAETSPAMAGMSLMTYPVDVEVVLASNPRSSFWTMTVAPDIMLSVPLVYALSPLTS